MDDLSARTTKFATHARAADVLRTDPFERAEAAARLGVQGDFMRVSQLATAIGMPANSIYAQMRHGTFPIPHRRVGNVVVVKLDDYVDWYRDAEPAAAQARLAASTSSDHSPMRRGAASPIETERQQAERIRKEVEERMRLRGFYTPGKR